MGGRRRWSTAIYLARQARHATVSCLSAPSHSQLLIPLNRVINSPSRRTSAHPNAIIYSHTSSVPMPSSSPTPSTTMPLMADTFQLMTGPIHNTPTRHRIRDWRPGNLTDLRHTLMRKAHFLHEKSGAKVCLHIQHKSQSSVYSLEQRPGKSLEDVVDGLRQEMLATHLDNLQYPPPTDHIVRLCCPGSMAQA